MSGSGAGIPACWGFTHSCARNDDDDDDNVVVIFAVVDGRGAQRWSVGSLGAIGDVGGLTQLARSPFLPLLIPSPITLPPSAPWLPLSVVRDGHWMVFGRVRSGRKMNMEQTDPNTGLGHLGSKNTIRPPAPAAVVVMVVVLPVVAVVLVVGVLALLPSS